MSQTWPWVVLALLGAYHGLNPAMGWLFALALGLQEKRRSAVIAALIPIALGHAVAIALAILILNFIQRFVPPQALKWMLASIIFGLGIYRLARASHPKGGGMRVGGRDLFVWSFLMASAHGAGLMLIPVLLSSTTTMHHNMAASLNAASVPIGMSLILWTTLVHTAAMLIVAGIFAMVFFTLYERFGLQLLRHTWFNFDLLWAIALLIAGVAVVF